MPSESHDSIASLRHVWELFSRSVCDCLIEQPIQDQFEISVWNELIGLDSATHRRRPTTKMAPTPAPVTRWYTYTNTDKYTYTVSYSIDYPYDSNIARTVVSAWIVVG